VLSAVDPSILSAQEAVRVFQQTLPRPVRLLVAISGGSDSTGLLVALAAHAGRDVALGAVTIDHRLRPESAAEAEAVAKLCATLDIPHTILAWTDEKPMSGISAAAREARYVLLCQAAADMGATAIVTGHTLDDQLETVAMRQARGDGWAPGHAGMADAVLLHRRHWLLRPFLRTWRQDIRDFLREAGHGWIDDPSNGDLRYERVRTRAGLSAGDADALCDIEAAGKRRRGLSDAAAVLLAEHAQVHHGVLMHLRPSALIADAAVLRHALSASAAVLGGREHGPASRSMDRVMELVMAHRLHRLTAGRVVFDIRHSGLFLCRENRDLPEIEAAAGETCVWDGRFRVTNEAAEPMTIGPSRLDRQEAQALFPDVPASIAVRAARAMPAARPAVSRLAPYDRFLPQFDYKLAMTLAELFACDTFPLVPWNDSSRKR
jgi:tRNA(Ile)-lysidine synthase